MKHITKMAVLLLMIACGQSKNGSEATEASSGGEAYIGTWTMSEIKDPKYSYYVHNYTISKNGAAYKVHVLVTCPGCGSTFPPSEYNYSGFYNQEKSRFEIQKSGFFESFTIDQTTGKAMSDRYPKFFFTKK